MEKIIKRTISLTTKKRDSRNKLFEEFYSHDKNNAVFEFTVEGGIPTEEIVVLFHFKRTNRHLEVRGRVDNDKIIVNFDTSLIIKDEQVAGYIYYENGEKSNDVYRFMFDVHVSEIDKEHDLPVMEMESKRIVPLTDIVTKSEITELLKKIVANEKLYDDTEIKQKIESKADKETVQAISSKVEALETKAIANGTYNDKPLLDKIHEVQESLKGFITQSSRYLTEHQSLSHLVTKDELARMGYINAHQSLEHLVTKEELEQKGFLNAHQSLVNLVTKDELENKHYLTNQDITNLATNSKVEAVESRVQTLENKPPVDLSHLATKQELEAVRNSQPTVDTSNLVTKQELEDKHYLISVPEVDTSHFVTRDELDSKHYVQDVSNLATNAKVNAVEARVQTIENKPAVDLSPFVTKQELEAKQYLKDHQPLDGYVKKSELPTPVDTSTLVSKQELTSMNLVNTEALGEVSKKILEQKTKITALEEKSGYEIHGTGMPNGRVTAPIGTTYVDMAVTNGALKWIKHSGDGNTGWKVFTGDTGWRTLNVLNKLGNAKIQIRRINDEVIVKFDGLSWGWFGMKPISQQGDSIVERSIGAKQYTWVKVDVGRGNDVIPEGFRSSSSILSGLYGDLGDLLGSVYLGGKDDSNALQLRYAMPRNEVSDTILAQIRISPITFTTDDDYPTTLP